MLIRRVGGSGRRVAGQLGQAQLVHAVEVALDLAPAAGLTDGGEHQPYLEVGRDLFQVA